jgi:hypothetical protein
LPVYFENFQTLVPSLFTDAQKFKTKFEECRKEIEEREKKGDVVPGSDEGGWVVGLLCRFTLHLAAAPVWCFFHLPKKQSRMLWLPLPIRGSAAAWGHSLMPSL